MVTLIYIIIESGDVDDAHWLLPVLLHARRARAPLPLGCRHAMQLFTPVSLIPSILLLSPFFQL